MPLPLYTISGGISIKPIQLFSANLKINRRFSQVLQSGYNFSATRLYSALFPIKKPPSPVRQKAAFRMSMANFVKGAVHGSSALSDCPSHLGLHIRHGDDGRGGADHAACNQPKDKIPSHGATLLSFFIFSFILHSFWKNTLCKFFKKNRPFQGSFALFIK